MKYCAIFLMLMLLVGCSASINETEEPIKPFIEAANTPQSPASASPQPTHVPEPTALPRSGIRVEPLITAVNILVPISWSPNGEWFAFRNSDLGQDFLYHLSNGSTCLLASAAGAGGMIMQRHTTWEWLSDSRLLIFHSDRVEITEPCAESAQDITAWFPSPPVGIRSASPDRSLFVITMTGDSFTEDFGYIPASFAVLDVRSQTVTPLPAEATGMSAGFSWSPDTHYLTAVAQHDLSIIHKARVWVIDVAANEIVRMINVELANIDTTYLGPVWLSESQFLIEHTLDRGSLLVTMGGEVQTMPELYDFTPTDANCDSGGCWLHMAAQASGEHLLWYVGEEDSTWLMLHAESGEIESTNFQGDIHFSPDGQYLLTWFRGNQRDMPALYLRPLDPPGSPAQPIAIEDMTAALDSADLFEWPSHSRFFAMSVHANSYIALYRTPDGQEIGRWWAEDYRLGFRGHWSLAYKYVASGVWSPDGTHLLVKGDALSGEGSALFLISTP